MESSSSSDVVGGILFLGIMIVCGAVVLGSLIFWLWMLIHSLTNNGITGSEKVAWVLVILFVQIIGAIVYFFIGRPKAKLAQQLPPSGPPPSV